MGLTKQILALFKRKSIVITVIVFSVTMLVCLILFSVKHDPDHVSEEKVFCSADDAMYQLIKSSKDEWINKFLSQKPTLGGTYDAFDIWTSNEQYGLVRPYHSSLGRPEFYVITESQWPGTQSYGSRGYWYTPAKDMSTSTRLRYQYLDDDIYCYWFTK